MTSAVPQTRSRYELLDAWRGLAALSVVGFHAVNPLVQAHTSWLAAALWQGWAGVYLFFPISGYCILAASTSGRAPDVWSFLRRRWRRIYPTYWASIAVCVAVALAAAPFSHGSLAFLTEPGIGWLSILTLTQGLAGMADAINPVYWSLCYEEQFYLLIAASMLCTWRWRRSGLLALSVISCLHDVPVVGQHLPRGLFVDYWLNFAVGLAVFAWFDSRFGKAWASGHLALAAAVTVVTGRIDLAVSLSFAVLLIAIRRHDAWLSRSASGRWLAPAGAISYSLYLTHVPIAGRVVNVSRWFGASESHWWPLVVIAATLVSVAFAAVFYRVIERRFLNLPAAQPVEVPSTGAAALLQVT